MSKSQRTKGATFEREVCDIFTAALGVKFKRNIGQARDGGNDIDIGRFVTECKRRKTLGTVYGWLNQAIAATVGRKVPATPIVVAREDNGQAIVIMRLLDFLELAGPTIKADMGVQ